MSLHFDALETRSREEREHDLFSRLPVFLRTAILRVPGLTAWLEGIDPEKIMSREALSTLPVLRKSELMRLQAEDPPFGGFADLSTLSGQRVFMSPGPIFEPELSQAQTLNVARAFFAAGIRTGDLVHNAFSYHMTPGGFMMDAGARALGCAVFPAGTGNTEMQVEAAAMLKPSVYGGTPDFLKILLDKAAETNRDLSSLRRGLVSGGALFPSLRAEYAERGVAVMQCYATAEFGVIAYETASDDGMPLPGMVAGEDLIVEIVRPGTGDPIPDGEVGELVVTCLNPAYPLLRLGTGDLSAIMTEPSPCGRTGTRIAGWMGRADQRTKIKGMFVDPRQVSEIVTRHPEIARARLVVTRQGEQDAMRLEVEPAAAEAPDTAALAASLREITKLGGQVRLVTPGSLPNDGKVISDERDYAR